MLPVIVIVGRPNVGKSSLFNRLTKSRDALVADMPGTTRDRQYGEARVNDQKFIVIDTGGVGESDDTIDLLTENQAKLATEEADHIILMVDARAGLTAADETIYQQCRKTQKPITVIVNKTDGIDSDVALTEFYRLGSEHLYPASVSHNRGVNTIIETILTSLPKVEDDEPEKPGIKFAVIGRPNVGKSTLVNRILGEERVIVLDQPGTTRDSIFIPFERRDQRYTIIDTAGVRRRKNISDIVEKFSVVKTLQAISSAHVLVMLFDAHAEIANQDLSLLGYALNAGKAIVLAINKWDGLEQSERDWIKKECDRKLAFMDFARLHFISAKHGTAVGDLFKSIHEAYNSAAKEIATPELNHALEAAVKSHQPPLVKGRRIKLRYAHMGGHFPPVIVIHGNQVESLPMAYQRYLINTFRKTFKLIGTQIRLQLQQGDNPFKDKKNTLTPRQLAKRKRLKKHIKKKH